MNHEDDAACINVVGSNPVVNCAIEPVSRNVIRVIRCDKDEL